MKTTYLISGKINSGKNEFGQMIQQIYEEKGLKAKQDLFAQGVKDGAREDFSLLTDYLNEQFERIEKEVWSLSKQKFGVDLSALKTKTENWYEEKTGITRTLLQIYGTDIFRNRVNKEFWVDQTIDRIQNSIVNAYIITDVRFQNEIDRIHNFCNKYKTVSIRIERKNVVTETDNAKEHLSETALDNYKQFTYIVENDGTLELLKRQAKLIVEDVEKENKFYLAEKVLY